MIERGLVRGKVEGKRRLVMTPIEIESELVGCQDRALQIQRRRQLRDLIPERQRFLDGCGCRNVAKLKSARVSVCESRRAARRLIGRDERRKDSQYLVDIHERAAHLERAIDSLDA